MALIAPAQELGSGTRSPRLGFLGLGWIGRSRLEALVREQIVTVAAVADPERGAAQEAAALAGGAKVLRRLEQLLELELDGIVIATPSALHAEQAIAALEAGVSVFVQKPLARNLDETKAVLGAARAAQRLVAVDLSYRETTAARMLREAIRARQLGEVFALELVFHNAYGPDKRWFLDRHLSGGGCLIDLGTHLVDLLLWLLDEHGAQVQAAAVRHHGRPLGGVGVEDFATAQLRTERGVCGRIACSWFLPAGRECVFECTAYGTEGSLAITNVAGSYYDFQLELRQGTSARVVLEPPDDWGGRALCAWARRLQHGEVSFDVQEAGHALACARVLDQIYAQAGAPQ